MHDWAEDEVYWVDHCPASARVACEVCGISDVAQFAGTGPEDYDRLKRDLVGRYTNHCGTALDVLLIEEVMTA